LRQVNPQRLTEVLQIKLRDLDLAQLRLSPQLAALAAGYRATLADYLGEPRATAGRPSTPKRFKNRRGADVETTVKKLDALDAQRQKIEAVLRDKEVQLPGN
jgi:Spy/CpxP family protein refolding chaperone